MDTFFIPLVNALGWTLIHSLWQAALIFVMLKLLLVTFKQMPAHFRYFLSLMALTGIVGCTVFTFFSQWQHQQAMLTWLAPAATIPVTSQVTATVPSIVRPDSIGPVSLMQIIDAVYLTGLLFFLVRFIRDMASLFILRRSRKAPFADAWENYLAKLSAHWGISRNVRLFLSEHIDVPVVIGHLKPIIYLPFSMANNLAPEHIEAILLHELAHIKRNDFLINIFQTAIETVLFFNPFVWWISKSIRRERENSCDDMVMKYMRPRLYADALVAVSENVLLAGRKTLTGGQFTMAAVRDRQELFYRIKRMMENKTKKLNVMQKLLVLLVLFGGILSIAWLAPEKCSEKPNEKTTAMFSNGKSQPILLADTTLPEPPPPPPAPVSPPPPAPKMDVPPPPPPPAPITDSADTTGNQVTFYRLDIDHSDSAFTRQWAKQIRKYYSSPEWKKYQQELHDYGKKMQEYFNNDQWKAYQQEMAEYTRKMQEEFNGPEWEKYRSEMADWAKKMAKDRQAKFTYFQSDAWKHRMDSLNQNIAIMVKNRAQLNALMASSDKERQKTLARLNGRIAQLGGNGYNVDPHQLVNRLSFDGLLKDRGNYKIRLDQRGLYINGKKQDEKYYDKYKNIVGDNTTVKIERHKGSFKSSISSKK